MNKFSVLFLQNIIEKLSTFSAKDQFNIHYYACLVLVKQFDEKQRLEELGIRKETVEELAISKYLSSNHMTD